MSEAKRLAGERAIDYVEDGMHRRRRHRFDRGLSSSTRWRGSSIASPAPSPARNRARERLRAHGIEVLDLNAAGPLPLYVDGADECDPHRRLIKGGGAALTREKIIAEASERFVCIIDPAKQVDDARHASRCRSR